MKIELNNLFGNKKYIFNSPPLSPWQESTPPPSTAAQSIVSEIPGLLLVQSADVDTAKQQSLLVNPVTLLH
jgi:hypothetical protein